MKLDKKVCRKCDNKLDISEFRINAVSKKGLPIYRSYCYKCQLSANTSWRSKRKESKEDYERYVRNETLRPYGINVDDYNRMFKEQGGKCKICESTTPKSKRNKHFYIDHDHKTGKVRGLLCNRCNSGLSCFEDTPAFLSNAIKYLEYNFSKNTQLEAA